LHAPVIMRAVERPSPVTPSQRCQSVTFLKNARG
jgi:hypothetical protein